MANFNFADELKKLVLAGVGAAAVTAEKAEKLVDYCVEKGEITVEQGKVMNEELKRNIKDSVQNAKDKAKATKDRARGKLSKDDVLNAVDNLSAEELEAIKEKIAAKEAEKEAEPVDAEIVDDDDAE